MSTSKKHDSGAAEGARRATEQSPESSAAGSGRSSSRRKVSVILELLRGADLETTSRKYRITASTLTQWRERFLEAGEAGLKSRGVDVEDEEKRRLKSVVANVSVEVELLREKIARLEGFGLLEVEAMSHTISPSSNKPYGVARLGSWRRGDWRVRVTTRPCIAGGTHGVTRSEGLNDSLTRNWFSRFAS